MIENSVIGLRCQHRRERHDSQFGHHGQSTTTKRPTKLAADRAAGRPPIGIGDGTVIEGAIVDKNCRIGRNVRIANDRGVETSDETPEAMIRDGIVCVQKGAVLARRLADVVSAGRE